MLSNKTIMNDNRIKKIGVAVIGLGVGEQHARAYLRTGHCKLMWLFDLDHDRARKLIKEFNTGKVADSYEQILEDPDVDVVSIASYDADHFAQVIAAFHSRKHVYVEKPVCRTLDEVHQVYKAWKGAGGSQRALSSNLVLRAAPLYQRLQKYLSEGLLGRIYAVDGEYLYGRLYKITEGWRSQEIDYSVMTGGGIHMIDLVLWLTGIRPVTIQAVGNRICTDQTTFRYKDFVTATAKMSNGAIARFTANFGCVHRHQHIIRIYGTKGTFLYDDAGARVHLSRDPRNSATPWDDSPLPATKGDLILNFIYGIMQCRDWTLEAETCLNVATVCAICDEALRNENTIEVVYP